MKKRDNQFICSSFMLPEHVDTLAQREKDREDEELRQFPAYDEQQLELWERILQASWQHGAAITVRFMDTRGPCTVTGRVSAVSLQQKRFYLATSEAVQAIAIERVMGLEQA